MENQVNLITEFSRKTVEGPNDFATMEEVIYRRYKRMLDEGENLPQLILIDGGKGQLSSAVKKFEIIGFVRKNNDCRNCKTFGRNFLSRRSNSVVFG